MHTQVFQITDLDKFKTQALLWAAHSDSCCYFDSNNFTDPYSAFDVCIAAGAQTELKISKGAGFDKLQLFLQENQGFVPGFFSYDLKNEIENLKSENPDFLHFPEMYFFVPKCRILIKANKVTIISSDPKAVWDHIHRTEIPTSLKTNFNSQVKYRISKEKYLNKVEMIKGHIQKGDIYELNFCQEFYAESKTLNPVNSFIKLNSISPTPFSSFFKIGEQYIISATPERFLSRKKNKLISQPIKGTAKRHSNTENDLLAIKELLSNEKELSENVMIVDLVRNDLTKSAKSGSVKVEELFGIYSFKQVHQMISTVVCEAAEGLSNAHIIRNTFPMGSMTGAPKIRAMELIEKYEETKRGIYSGAAGYFNENGDFDFNVVIRTILYNSESGYLSFQAGSAITIDSDAGKEYQECLLKAEAIFSVLKAE
ncbi:anthranilate synthase component I family protein [Daejeonella oryzae]|uniref:anthranilate synthase component I family protein n=1 Tax=Daejeonella oryzae TaxID=1122943 RepID=UPI0003F70EFB|nr:anthranilate synthase component I family protein [Daejeonella oryzae]